MPTAFWKRADVTGAVADLDLSTVVRLLRAHTNLTQEAIALRAGLSQSTVSRLETGRPAHDLGKVRVALRGLGAPGVSDLGNGRHVHAELNAASGPPPFDSAVGSRGAPPENVLGSDAEAVHAFRLADRRVGGGHLYTAVMHYLTTRVGPELVAASDSDAAFVSAAGLTEMAGWMAYDAGRAHTAARHFHRALTLARAAGAATLTAQVWASRSHLALHHGDHRAALSAAEHGWAELDGSEDAALRGRLLAMKARARAAAGETAQSLAALHEAKRLLTARPAPIGFDWTSPFDEGSLASEAARAMCDLGDYASAAAYTHRALELREPDRLRARTLASLLRARALLGQGEVEQACAVAVAAGHSLGAVSSQVVAEEVHTLTQALIPFTGTRSVDAALPRLRGTVAQHNGMYHWLAGEQQDGPR
ncbi:helix-turn-helix domain-containing protein [Streptomonospora sp. S1-112]|uniref:Helix-turn-helix domain-containing protein n=1 Tax=Streptomonospora mangrovi TaxID=2883123 RepID=A0A9X3NLA3_9ACTN|nr:helix-turn-helix transcriptional regulator [Streptomonospora mangrovi]MDA0564151.1 helix-turn-helix domain-containing protein [Streptomonospora mangrovi]